MKSHKMIPIACLLLASLLFSSTLSAKPDFRQYESKGNDHIKQMHDMAKKYKLAGELMTKVDQIENNWVDVLSNYRHSLPQQRNESFRKVQNVYDQILNVSEHTSMAMRGFLTELDRDFAEKLKLPENQNLDRDKYVHSVNVLQKELARGDAALRRKQWYYATHVYDHAIDIMKKAYERVNLPLPPALQTPAS